MELDKLVIHMEKGYWFSIYITFDNQLQKESKDLNFKWNILEENIVTLRVQKNFLYEISRW